MSDREQQSTSPAITSDPVDCMRRIAGALRTAPVVQSPESCTSTSRHGCSAGFRASCDLRALRVSPP
jgi:hypothetical protein